MLTSSDLNPISYIAGDGALDYAHIIGSFHYINRIADLLNVSPEILPLPLRRFELLRRLVLRLFSYIISKMNLANREYGISYEEALNNIAPIFEQATGKMPKKELEHLKSRPKLIEILQMMLEEREVRSSLDRPILSKIHHTVEVSLPKSVTDSEGFHTRPEDPIEEFAFVGTRYAYRMTKSMIDRLKREGYEDVGILDLAIAVADSNEWARMYRLLDLDPNIFYITT